MESARSNENSRQRLPDLLTEIQRTNVSATGGEKKRELGTNESDFGC
jgi:hypothetical protein